MEYATLLRDYLDDANGHLNAFDESLMSLEKNGNDSAIILGALGSLHTLKGNSGMMGFESLKIYIHQIEGILKKVNDNEIKLSGVIDNLLSSANIIRNALMLIESEPGANPELAEHILRLQRLHDGSKEAYENQTVELSSYLGTKTDTIKVDFKRLNDLLNLIGELVIFKTRLNQIESRVRGTLSDKPLAKELNEGLEFMGKAISEVQEGIMKTRMLPVNHVFNKFPRMVRDIAKSQGKEINLFFEGEDTELDKTVIDELGEPLLHIIRNGIDHGIETTEERIKRGKPRRGTITLSAVQESNHVIISVKDDGKGISIEKIREKAIEKGLLRQEDSYDKEAILSLIFSAGFTTKMEATELSGRGIGLDVVSRNISRLNGHVYVDTVPEKGTSFVIKLPLSLAIAPALMAEANGEIYAIPMSSVDESVKVKEDDIHVINNHEVIKFREKVIPVIRLDDFFSLNKSDDDRNKRSESKNKRFYLVIIGRGEKRIAIAVDRLNGQQEIVIKPIDDTFGKSHGIAGASILGNGRIVLIIDVMAFWKTKTVNNL